ncbi:MAG: hypothetical protein WCF68_11185 [Terriglobales bacterium]
MSRLRGTSVLLIVTCAAFTQTVNHSISSDNALVAWRPPAWNFLTELPKATVSKEMVATLRVSNVPIYFEKTKMDEVRARLGGTTGHAGDAGDYVEWLCFRGTDPKGLWVLWLESGEIDGGMVGSFQWQRLANSAMLDRRCRTLQDTRGGIELPLALRLGMAETEVRKTLGPPTAKRGDRLIYVHEHQESIRGEPYTSENIVAILLRDGMVWAIEVSKSTTS